MPKKKTDQKRSYGKYVIENDGKLYAVVRLPLGKGKYKKKTKLLSTLGSGTKTEALKWALDKLEKHKSGDVAPNTKLTFDDLAKWYKKEFLFAPIYKDDKRVLGVRTYKHQQVVLDRLCEEFGLYKLEKITLDVLRGYKKKRLKDVSITPINREFALIRTMFKKAVARKWLKESPFDLGEPLIEVALENTRKSPLTVRTAKRLLARSRKSDQPLLHYLVLICMFTGARPSEIFPYRAKDDDEIKREPLIWKNILDFDYKAVRLISYKGKIKKERVVPASVELERGLRRMHAEVNPESEDDLLFPVTSFKRSWATLCRSVGCTDVWLRDFRHYFNSVILVNSQFNDAERLLLLGQTRLETNMRYSHLDETFIEKFRNVTSEIPKNAEAVVIESKSDNN